MATLKSLFKCASRELRTSKTHTDHLSHETLAILRYTTPAIHVQDPQAALKLSRYLFCDSNSINPHSLGHHLTIYAFCPHHTVPTLQTIRNAVNLICAHASSSGNTAFAIYHPPTPKFHQFDQYLLPYAIFPLVSFSLTPLSVCLYFTALQARGLLLHPHNPAPLLIQPCTVHDSQNFRYVRGLGQTPHNAIRALVQAITSRLLEQHISRRGMHKHHADALLKWARLHPTNRVSTKHLRMLTTTPDGHVRHTCEFSDTHPVVEMLTTLSRSSPLSKPMIRITHPRERWHPLSFLAAITPNTNMSSVTTQDTVLCQRLSAKCHTYMLTCLDGRERGFHVCHPGERMDCVAVVVEMEIVEEADASRSVTGMRLMDDVRMRMGFKQLACAPVGNVVCWRGCCGFVESLGVVVHGVPGDQLVVADCSQWFVGLI